MANSPAPIEPHDPPTVAGMGLGWEASSSVVFFRLLDPDEVPPAPDPEPFGFNQASSH